LNSKKPQSKIYPSLFAALLLPLLGACAFPLVPGGQSAADISGGNLSLDRTTFGQLPGWKADTLSEALPAFLRSCAKLKALPPDRRLKPAIKTTLVSQWLPICAAAAGVPQGNETKARYFFEIYFTPYRASNYSRAQGLFTGYYEAELRGAWRPDTTYRYPIYAHPKDLVSINLGKFKPKWGGEVIAGRLLKNKIVPYATRADINDGVLKGKQLELLWVDSAIDAFFLHIQGSGRVVLPDGSQIRIGFAGRNGHPYTAIGRDLVGRGILSSGNVSMQTIRAWLQANPLAGAELMNKNKSFIFFRIQEKDGPIGAQGVTLTPGRSLAIDRRHIPYGVPIWLNTTLPGKSGGPLRRLVIAQDTGSAIKGPVRGDLFLGYGTSAGNMAGRMKQSGTYYLLLPK